MITFKNPQITMVTRANDENTYQRVKYFWIEYKFLQLSSYYDPTESLGVMTGPYFEIYANDDVIRFSNDEAGLKDLEEFVNQICAEHDLEIKLFPERFL